MMTSPISELWHTYIYRRGGGVDYLQSWQNGVAEPGELIGRPEASLIQHSTVRVGLHMWTARDMAARRQDTINTSLHTCWLYKTYLVQCDFSALEELCGWEETSQYSLSTALHRFPAFEKLLGRGRCRASPPLSAPPLNYFSHPISVNLQASLRCGASPLAASLKPPTRLTPPSLSQPPVNGEKPTSELSVIGKRNTWQYDKTGYFSNRVKIARTVSVKESLYLYSQLLSLTSCSVFFFFHQYKHIQSSLKVLRNDCMIWCCLTSGILPVSILLDTFTCRICIFSVRAMRYSYFFTEGLR